MAHGYIKTPTEVVHEGDEVEAVVLDVNRRKKQIRLSMKALQTEVPEFTPAKVEKKGRRKGSSQKESMPVEAVDKQPELTAMEIAWQEALARAEAKDKEHKDKHNKKSDKQEQEDILNRTLEHRIPTGS
jgi:transcriptional accessory protein Tex/SPT6